MNQARDDSSPHALSAIAFCPERGVDLRRDKFLHILEPLDCRSRVWSSCFNPTAHVQFDALAEVVGNVAFDQQVDLIRRQSRQVGGGHLNEKVGSGQCRRAAVRLRILGSIHRPNPLNYSIHDLACRSSREGRGVDTEFGRSDLTRSDT